MFKLFILLTCIAALPIFAMAQSIAKTSKVTFFAIRLKPNQDLRIELEKFTKEHKVSAGFIVTTVGSLKETKLRLADQSGVTAFEGKFEIVSLVGTLAIDGVHLHLSVSDSVGKTIGGHLVEGCKIYTTAEIVIGVSDDIVFTRETDSETTYKELTIRQNERRKK